MKGKKAVRIALDATLTAMIVFEMLIQFTGEFLHEVVGFAFFVTVTAHLILSARWMKKTAQNAKAGKLTARSIGLAVIGILLAVAMVALGVSSIAISGILSSAGLVWTVGPYSLWVTVHTFSSYALCALVIVHLAMHWAFLAHAFKVPYDPSRRRAISTGVNATATLGVAAMGVLLASKMQPMVLDASSNLTGADSGSASGNNPASNAASSSSGSGKSSGRKSGSTAPGESGPTSAGNDSGSASGSGSGSGSGSENGSSTVSGICTLCRKQCSLSAPKCNKPYEAGLL